MSGGCCTSYEDEDLLAWVLGDLSEEDGSDLMLHLAECPGCRGRATEYSDLERLASACREGDVIRWRGFESPFGTMRVASSRCGLVDLTWQAANDGAFVEALERRYDSAPVVCDCDHLVAAQDQLLEYFQGVRESFDLPIDLAGLTPFQQAVLQAAAGLDFGEVATYTEIASSIGRPGASRAVGNALGRNPLAIIVPCHRVVRSDGSLGGYTGGLEYKEALLDIEGRADLIGGGSTADQPELF